MCRGNLRKNCRQNWGSFLSVVCVTVWISEKAKNLAIREEMPDESDIFQESSAVSNTRLLLHPGFRCGRVYMRVCGELGCLTWPWAPYQAQEKDAKILRVHLYPLCLPEVRSCGLWFHLCQPWTAEEYCIMAYDGSYRALRVCCG